MRYKIERMNISASLHCQFYSLWIAAFEAHLFVVAPLNSNFNR